jgi:hypothetical protein
MITGSTPISQFPTGTIASSQDVLLMSVGMPTGAHTIRTNLSQFSQALKDLGLLIASPYTISPSISNGGLALTITGPAIFHVYDTDYSLSAPVSFTSPSGTNWCNAGSAELAANPIDFFVYAIGETGASAGLKFGYSRIPFATTMSDFVNTTTSEKYIKGNWSNFNATDKVANIGRFRAQLSASSAYVWSIATSVVINRPIYETDVLTWTPAQSASGSLVWGTLTLVDRTYQIIGRRCFATLDANGALSGSASTTLYCTLPFDALLPGAGNLTNAQVADPSSVLGWGWITAGTPDKATARKYDASNFATGVTGYMRWVGNYPIG